MLEESAEQLAEHYQDEREGKREEDGFLWSSMCRLGYMSNVQL